MANVAAIRIRVSKGGLDLASLVAIRQCVIKLSLFRERGAAIVVGLSVPRVECDRSAVIFNCAVEILFVVLGPPTIVERGRSWY